MASRARNQSARSAPEQTYDVFGGRFEQGGRVLHGLLERYRARANREHGRELGKVASGDAALDLAGQRERRYPLGRRAPRHAPGPLVAQALAIEAAFARQAELS